MLTNAQIEKILNQITDPQTGQGLIDSKRVVDIKIQDQTVSFTIALPNLNVPYKSSLYQICHETLWKELGQDIQVHIHVEAIQQDRQNVQSPVPHIKNVIAVASGKGGVGKSTIASNLALGLKEIGYRVGLLDADLYGPSLPTLFDLKGAKPQVKKIQNVPKLVPLEGYGIPVMSVGFVIEAKQAVILRGPRLAGLIKQFINECLWPELDVLVIDLPPGTGDIQLTLVQTVPVTGAVMVTTPQEVAVADAIKAANMFLLDSINVPILGVVENMSWFTPREFPDHKYLLFGEGGGQKLADLCEAPLLGQVPLVQGVRESGDRGKPAVLHEDQWIAQPFKDLAQATINQLQIRNASLEPTNRVIVKR